MTQAEYAEAVMDMLAGREITNPKLSVLPGRPQCLLTFDNAIKLINSFILKFGRYLVNIDHDIKNYFNSFNCHFAETVQTVVSELVSTHGE